MKKLYLLTNHFPFGSGESFLLEELKSLEKHFDVTLVSQDSISKQTGSICAAVKVLRVPAVTPFQKALLGFASLFDARFLRERRRVRPRSFSRTKAMLAELAEAKHVTRFLRKRVTEADILYSYWFTPKVLSLLEISKGKIPVVTRAHRYDLYLEANKLNCQFYKQEMEPSLSRIFFISGFGRDYFLSRFHKEEGPKYQIARLGVTGPARLPGHNHARELRLVSCSNCIEVKRVERIVQALSMAQGFAVSWLHIGGGSGLKGLILLAQALLGPLPHVEYAFQGEVPAGKVCDIYDEHDFDLFVSASASEGIPVSMMECMSRGIPVLSTDVGAVSELVNQSNGILIAPDAKAEDLWDKLRAFYFMTCEEKQAMRQSAYETFRRDYRAEINYENFCRDLLKLTE